MTVCLAAVSVVAALIVSPVLQIGYSSVADVDWSDAVWHIAHRAHWPDLLLCAVVALFAGWLGLRQVGTAKAIPKGPDGVIGSGGTFSDLLFLAATVVVLWAMTFGFVTKTSASASPDNKSGRLTEMVSPHNIEYVGGGAEWAVFERGLIYGDSQSPLEHAYMWSDNCVADRGSDLVGQTACGRNIRWIDVSNPTPFMLAVLLVGVGVFERTRQARPAAIGRSASGDAK